jgi:transposase
MAQQSSIRPLLALPDYFRITDLQINDGVHTQALTLSICSSRRFACCPLCQRPSRRAHSHYVRILADLPCGGQALLLNVTVRRFFCGNPHCPRRVFAERLPELRQPYARRTRRQRDKRQGIGVATGGRAGARLADTLGVPTSFKTLLRLIMASPCPQYRTPRVLGVDDWACRKGHRYATILYDLETHQTVDLLPDRTAESLTAWLKAHPGVEILSRDRASAYSEGALAAVSALRTGASVVGSGAFPIANRRALGVIPQNGAPLPPSRSVSGAFASEGR